MTGLRLNDGILSLDGLDRRYFPQVVQFNGLGQWPFGASQEYMNRIGGIQNKLIVRLGEVNAANQPVWDKIWETLRGKTIPGTSYDFWGWDYARTRIIETQRTLIVRADYTPNEGALAAAADVDNRMGATVGYYVKVAPELAPEVQRASQWAQQQVASMPALKSTTAEGMKTFWEELDKRSKMFGGIGTVALITVAAIAASSFLGRGVRSNPQKKKKRDLYYYLQYAVAGAALYSYLKK